MRVRPLLQVFGPDFVRCRLRREGRRLALHECLASGLQILEQNWNRICVDHQVMQEHKKTAWFAEAPQIRHLNERPSRDVQAGEGPSLSFDQRRLPFKSTRLDGLDGRNK